MVKRALMAAATVVAMGCGATNDTSELDTLEDMEFLAFVAPAPGDEPRTVRLSDYYAENRPGTKIIMINAAAGWCVPCMREAAAMSEFAAAYESQGVAVLTAVFQDQNGDPADAAFVRAWVESFELSVPAFIDSTFQMNVYFDVNTMPANMFVDAETLEILQIATGADTGDDPMREYRELLDYYLQ